MIECVLHLKQYGFSLSEVYDLSLKQFQAFMETIGRLERKKIGWQIRASWHGARSDADRVNEVLEKLED